MEYNRHSCTSRETVSLIDVFKILRKRKKLIISITILMTLISFVYVNYFAKPLYSGTVTIEIGQVINKNIEKGNVQIIDLESTNTLKSLIESKLKISVSIINNSNLIKYSYISKNKKVIERRLKEAIKFTLERDKKLAKLYSTADSKIIYTKVIVPVNILNKENKKLIIIASFISGFIFSIFIAFFVEFLIELKNTRDKKEI